MPKFTVEDLAHGFGFGATEDLKDVNINPGSP